jgi:alpha-1,2-glucosyltransferase
MSPVYASDESILNGVDAESSVVHPFLLADNRHYFFYIWRRIFGLHWSVRYALTPGYLVCLWLWTAKLGELHIWLS